MADAVHQMLGVIDCSLEWGQQYWHAQVFITSLRPCQDVRRGLFQRLKTELLPAFEQDFMLHA